MMDLKKDIVTNIKIDIKDPLAFEELLKERFQNYKIRYKKFSAIYMLKNKSFVHSIWYSPKKFSKLKSERARELREVIIANCILILLMLLTLFANDTYNWFSDNSILMEIWMPIMILINWVIYRLKPKYKEELEEEHDIILNYLRTLNK